MHSVHVSNFAVLQTGVEWSGAAEDDMTMCQPVLLIA